MHQEYISAFFFSSYIDYFALVFVFLGQYDVNTCAEQTVALANTSTYGELWSTEFPLHTLAVWPVKLIRHYSQIYIF